MKRAALVLGLSVLLAGCSGDADETRPAALPPISASPVAPTASAPPTGDLRAQAAETARLWVDALNAAYATLNTDQLRRLSDPGCVTCQAYIDSMRESKQLGETWQGGITTVRDAVAAPLQGNQAEVLVDYDASAFFVRSSAGAASNQQPERRNATLQFTLLRSGNGWVVGEVGRL